MEDNTINHSKGTIIMNGGNPLPGCPENFDDANKWADNANGEKEDYEFPTWKFDCGFKLDFDGPILSVSSRFYPPKTHYVPTWDGTVTVKILDKEVEEKKFDCKTLDELRSEVEKYVDEVRQRVADVFKS